MPYLRRVDCRYDRVAVPYRSYRLGGSEKAAGVTWIVKARDPDGKVHSILADDLSQIVEYVADQRRQGREVSVEKQKQKDWSA